MGPLSYGLGATRRAAPVAAAFRVRDAIERRSPCDDVPAVLPRTMAMLAAGCSAGQSCLSAQKEREQSRIPRDDRGKLPSNSAAARTTAGRSGRLLQEALGFAGLPSADGSLLVLNSYLGSWAGIARGRGDG